MFIFNVDIYFYFFTLNAETVFLHDSLKARMWRSLYKKFYLADKSGDEMTHWTLLDTAGRRVRCRILQNFGTLG